MLDVYLSFIFFANVKRFFKKINIYYLLSRFTPNLTEPSVSLRALLIEMVVCMGI